MEDDKILLRRFQPEELVRATNNFSEECLVGSGAFGNVYRGTFHDEGTLAIKKPHADSHQSVEEFRNGNGNLGSRRIVPRIYRRFIFALFMRSILRMISSGG